jgi:hypothetical protein
MDRTKNFTSWVDAQLATVIKTPGRLPTRAIQVSLLFVENTRWPGDGSA